MEFFKIRQDIPFMRHALVFNAISALTFVAAVFFLFSRGLHLSVEFTGGTLMEVHYAQAADLNTIRGAVAGLGISDVQVQNFGTAQDVLIRMPVQKGGNADQQTDRVITALKTGRVSGATAHRICRAAGRRRTRRRWPEGARVCGRRHHDLSGCAF